MTKELLDKWITEHWSVLRKMSVGIATAGGGDERIDPEELLSTTVLLLYSPKYRDGTGPPLYVEVRDISKFLPAVMWIVKARAIRTKARWSAVEMIIRSRAVLQRLVAGAHAPGAQQMNLVLKEAYTALSDFEKEVLHLTIHEGLDYDKASQALHHKYGDKIASSPVTVCRVMNSIRQKMAAHFGVELTEFLVDTPARSTPHGIQQSEER